MKIGVISQRVDIVASYKETRDAIDVNWHNLFADMGAALVPIGNEPKYLHEVLDRIHPDFIVLSGGNTPVSYGGSSPKRDEIDQKLITYAIQEKIPLLGVCRGMQSVALYFESTLKEVDGHVAVLHDVNGIINREVNSFHRYVIDEIGKNLKVLAKTVDGSIEAIRHNKHAIYGIMWHPERVEGFDTEDIRLIKEWLNL